MKRVVQDVQNPEKYSNTGPLRPLRRGVLIMALAALSASSSKNSRVIQKTSKS
jgi:hypothetical protein